jgi:hypothetical protein
LSYWFIEQYEHSHKQIFHDQNKLKWIYMWKISEPRKLKTKAIQGSITMIQNNLFGWRWIFFSCTNVQTQKQISIIIYCHNNDH